MRTMTCFVMLSALLAALPLAVARPVDAGPRYVCVQPNSDCYYLPYANCVSGYDDNGAGDPVGYLCTRGPIGVCLFQYPEGDGTTCVVLLMSDPRGDVCAVSYSPWEYEGYQQYACVGIIA